MEGATPARLYATLVGALLVIAGIIGFFYSASFGSPGGVEEVFGVFSVNAWHNVFHIVTGAIGLLVAGYAARQYALWFGLLYIAVAAWGFALGSGHSILGVFPIDTEDNVLHLVLGVLGVGAFLATPGAAPPAPASPEEHGPGVVGKGASPASRPGVPRGPNTDPTPPGSQRTRP